MDEEKDQLISADTESDGTDDKPINPDLLDEMDDDAALEDDLEEEAAEFADEDEEEDDDDYNIDSTDE